MVCLWFSKRSCQKYSLNIPLSDTSITCEPSEFETDSGSDFHPPSDADLLQLGKASQKMDLWNLDQVGVKNTAYINIQVNVVNKGRHTVAQNHNRRSTTRIFTLPKKSGDMVTICKSFFRKALQVSDGRLTKALINKSIGGELINPPLDKRGKHPPKNKTRYLPKGLPAFPKFKHLVAKTERKNSLLFCSKTKFRSSPSVLRCFSWIARYNQAPRQ
ncbi:unnamed protein product [Diabrotica balteata]|uniref:Uncharacterized protein n=1 Tax=Diabrotica balteata TaxID=107213 RepID=A0A9N9T397_DIABA|nr:unnamed protein product [Diabrotica balteata]